MSEIRAIKETMTKLQTSMDKLECEMIDVVNEIGELSNGHASDKQTTKGPKTPPQKPLFRNPTNIPNYDHIEVVNADVHHTPADTSIVSMEEFVPDDNIGDTSHQNNPLNLEELTNQL